MENSVTIRLATITDAEQIIQHTKTVLVESSHFLGTNIEEFNPTVEEEEKWIQSHKGNGLLLVAETKGTIIGMLNFRKSTSKKFKHKGLFGMSIQEGYTNQGIGRQLITKLLDWAKEEGSIEKITLEVFSNNDRAIHLYKKLGFIEEGRLVKNAKIGPNQYVDDIVMSIFL